MSELLERLFSVSNLNSNHKWTVTCIESRLMLGDYDEISSILKLDKLQKFSQV